MEPLSQSPPLFESRIRGLKKIHQGKVRDIYEVDADHMLIVTTDRLSAFDVVLPDPIPFKGECSRGSPSSGSTRPGTSSRIS